MRAAAEKRRRTTRTFFTVEPDDGQAPIPACYLGGMYGSMVFEILP